MRPESNQAMEGLFANFILKAKHHNTFAPSQGRPSLWFLSLGRSRESDLLSVNHRLKNSVIAMTYRDVLMSCEAWMLGMTQLKK